MHSVIGTTGIETRRKAGSLHRRDIGTAERGCFLFKCRKPGGYLPDGFLGAEVGKRSFTWQPYFDGNASKSRKL